MSLANYFKNDEKTGNLEINFDNVDLENVEIDSLSVSKNLNAPVIDSLTEEIESLKLLVNILREEIKDLKKGIEVDNFTVKIKKGYSFLHE